MDLIPTLLQYKWVIIFYTLIFLIIYLNRKKFEFQGKIIAIYRTKLGIALMEKLGKKYEELIKVIGYIAIGVGFLGMFVILFMIGFSLYLFFNGIITTGQAPVTVAPVVPGIPIPDSPFQLPLIEGFLAIFIVVVIHEGSHGLVAVANRLKIKNTGYVQFGPIAGAFVEPDEKTLKKQSDVVQYSIFAAGPFSNILTAIVVLLLFSFVMAPLNSSMTEPYGFTFIGIQADQPAAHAGLKPGVVYNVVNNKTITNNADFTRMVQCASPGTIFYIANENYTYKLVSIPNPKEPERAYLGISCYSSSDGIKCVDTAYMKKASVNTIKYQIISWFADVLKLVYILSLGIGLINLLPLGPVDGGRMFQLSAIRIFGKDKGMNIWGKLSIILLIILLVLLLPVLRSILVAIIGLFG
jgi:membrane-associated protease RseP (regulator of RpoE activity)